jgi:RimJ/RimL family protein N-acetyltransferase
MILRKYKDDDFEVLQGWVKDAEILFRFSGPDWSYPLTRIQLDEYMAKHPIRQFYMGVSEAGTAVAFGEIITGDAYGPRLGRLLIGDEEQRGKGLGQAFVKELLEVCRHVYQLEQVFLFVFEDNMAGINCYKKCGFEFCGDEHVRLNRDEKQFKVLKMGVRLKLDT